MHMTKGTVHIFTFFKQNKRQKRNKEDQNYGPGENTQALHT